MNSIRKVLSKEFHSIIGPLDVTLSVEGNYPYKTVFKLKRGGRVVGWQDTDGAYYLRRSGVK